MLFSLRNDVNGLTFKSAVVVHLGFCCQSLGFGLGVGGDAVAGKEAFAVDAAAVQGCDVLFHLVNVLGLHGNVTALFNRLYTFC